MVIGADMLADYSNKPQPLSGSARIGLFHYQGSTVSVRLLGDASHIPAEELRYQWQRKSGDSWANIPGATEKSYRVQAADVTADAIRVVVKGNEEHGYSSYLISNSCLIVGSIPLTEDYFPDPCFRQYLDDKFNTDGNYVLDLAKNTALEQLYCGKNELTELNLGSNAALTYVDADENQLTQLDLSGLPALETLWVYHNQLTELRLSANPELKNLACNCNEITKLNISNCPKLISAYRGTRSEGTEDGVPYLSYKDDNNIRLLIDASVTVKIDKPNNPFVDVHESDFFFNPVMWAVEEGVTGGTDDTYFSPYNTVMRCDSMVFFWAAKNRPAHADIQSPFVDVKPKHWYYGGAIRAYEYGLERGEGGKFNAKTPCTRGYVVTYLYRFITGQELAQ